MRTVVLATALFLLSSAVHATEPQGKFEILVGNRTAARFHTETGDTWLLLANKWKRAIEPGKLTPGEYDVKMFTSSDGKVGMFRIEKLSGKGWQIIAVGQDDFKWVAIGDEPDPGK
jgi:hypothetical protein